MSKDYKIYIEDILEAIHKIDAYLKGMTFEQFSKDTKTVDAVVRNLEVIGEAIKSIPQNIKEKNRQIEWKKIAGLRDILIHQYFGVDLEIVWDVTQNKLPSLKRQMEEMAQNK